MKSVCNYKLLAILVLLIITTSCNYQGEAEFPDVGIEREKLNQELEIIHLTPNKYKISEPIKLMVRLNSDVEVYSEMDFGAQMFILSRKTGQWVEVYDPVTSYSDELNLDLNEILNGTDNIVLSTKDKNKLDQRAITLHPVIESDNKSIKMMIIVSGNIYENGVITDQKVGAYTIITL